MHDYLLSTEWVRFAFVLGVAVSMVLYEKRHLTTGSIVVPGYIAVFLPHPLVIAATFLNAFITYALVNKVLRRYFLLYGRTKFTLLAAISTILQTIMLRVTPSGQWLWERDIPLFIGVGYVIPALIAHDMGRQGIAKTCKAVLLAGTIVAIPIAVALVLDLPGVNDLAPISGFGTLAIDPTWLPVAILLSVIASWAVAFNYDYRSGGFVGAAFVGMFMADPWQVLAAAIIAVLTYLIVAKFLMNHMILFGRRKFSSMLLVSSTIAWTGLWLGQRFLDVTWVQHLGVGSLALTPLLLPGLVANDAQRTSPVRVLKGLALAALFTVSTTWSLQSALTDLGVLPLWPALSVATGVVLFAPQLAPLVDRFRATSKERLAHVREALHHEHHDPPTVANAMVPTPAATAAAASWVLTPWHVWARRHPDLAADAEVWLNRQLGATTPKPRVPGAAAAGTFDLVADQVLHDALSQGRGVSPRQVERTPNDATRSPQISETPDAAREAQLAASGVSGEFPPAEDGAGAELLLDGTGSS